MLKTYKLYYSFLWHYKKQFILFILVLIGTSIFSSIQPYFYKLFIDSIPGVNHEHLFYLLSIFIVVRFLDLITANLMYYFSDSVIFSASRDVRLAVFKRIHDLDFAYHLSKSTGSLLSVIKRGDGAFFDLHNTVNINMAKIVISLIVVLGFFFKINWQLNVALFLSFFVNFLFARFLIKNNLETRNTYNKVDDEIAAIITDNLINYETVKLFAKEDWEYDRLEGKYKTWLKALWLHTNSFRLIDVVVGTTGNIGLFIVLLLGLSQVSKNNLTAGDYVMVIGFVTSFYPKFFELVYQLRNLTRNYSDIEKYFDILNLNTVVKDPICPLKLAHLKGEIIFDNVYFSYPDGKRDAINCLNLTVKPGESVAFVGHSGVGKTTIIKLLMRFFDPTSGQILLDGVNIKNFTKNNLRSFMGTVPQEPVLFNNTIAYNIAYGAINPNKKEIIKAAKLANLHNFIESLPAKYETQVGERGMKLSGGQKQRLAIARMILSNPDIIIFDEATSQLDSESERQIQDAFWKAAEGKTTLIIAHRLSTITRADKIIVLNHGGIAEIGTHDELLRINNGVYSRFWTLQTQN
jgi:ATP-binding cassette subfamily B protein